MIDFTIYDTHCHIFTLRYAIREARDMLHDWISGDYDTVLPRDVLKRQTRGHIISNVKMILKQFAQFTSAALGDEESNMEFIRNKARKTWETQQKVVIVPLMMDVFYMFSSPLTANQDLSRGLKMRAPVRSHYEGLEDDFEEILEDLKNYLKSDKEIDGLLKATGKDNKIAIIDEEIRLNREAALKAKDTRDYGFYQTAGFIHHFEKLISLQQSHKNEIFPFFAVDPRRPGVVEAAQNQELVGKNGPFYGIKLYPRLGYHPACKPLLELYKHCKKNRIPVLVHCGKSGFPPSDNWKHADFCNPVHFKPVLDNDLIIDFAHLGSADESMQWADKIVEYIGKYDNVYTDLACYTNREEILKIKNRYPDNQKLKSRLMFGTDFDVMYATDKVTMESYFKNFLDLYTEQELKTMSHIVPQSFLGLS